MTDEEAVQRAYKMRTDCADDVRDIARRIALRTHLTHDEAWERIENAIDVEVAKMLMEVDE